MSVEDVLEFRLLPALDPENNFFWTSGADGRLRFLRCADCRHYLHPPAPLCPECLGTNVAPEPVSGRGRVYSFTINVQQWTPGASPYVIAVVEIEEQPGLRLTSNLVGTPPEDVRIGLAVEVVFVEREDVWLPLFRERTS